MEYDSLLLPLFYELRRQGVPLGIAEYQLAIQTLRAGIGLGDVSSLKRLCRLLWAKSREDQILFDNAFTELVEIQLEPPLDLDEFPPYHQSNIEKTPLQSIIELTDTSTVTRKVPLKTFPKAGIDSSKQEKKYRLTPQSPLDVRITSGHWRHLSHRKREGVLEELDVEETIRNICENGFFLRPTLRPHRRNQLRLIILIDQLGSMAPFSLLIDAFIKSIQLGHLWDNTFIYYFHDCPEEIIYEQRDLTAPLLLEDMLVNRAKNASVLIISDAGAARGYYESKRSDVTKAFLKLLSPYTYLYAWLNPMPISRWRATIVEDLTSLVPMFPLDEDGIYNAIAVLKGYSSSAREPKNE